MSEKYVKSKKLGYDYLNDRTSHYLDEIQFNLVQNLCVDILGNFTFKKYMEICETSFKSIEYRLEQYLNNDDYLLQFDLDSDFDLFIVIDKYESEDDFIKRKNKEKRNKDKTSNKKINELTKEASYLSKEEREKLIKEILNVK